MIHSSKERAVHVVAVASAGGHWVQLQRLRPAFDGCELTYVTTEIGYRAQVETEAVARAQLRPRYFVVPQANRWQKARLVWQLLRLAALLAWFRPDVVVSTGAAPGYFALRIGKMLGARTIWIDSFANSAELSYSGQRVGPYADLWLTQWQHLACKDGKGPKYVGAVL